MLFQFVDGNEALRHEASWCMNFHGSESQAFAKGKVCNFQMICVDLYPVHNYVTSLLKMKKFKLRFALKEFFLQSHKSTKIL